MTSKTTIRDYFSVDPPQAILFDLDGTLVDSVPDLACAVDAALHELGLNKVGEACVRSWVGNGAWRLMQRALAYSHDVVESAVEPTALKQAHQCFLSHYAKSNGKASQVYPQVLSSLQAWQQQHIPMAIVTNKPIQFVPALLAQLSLDRYFSVLVGGECTATKKPSPAPLYFACQQLQVDPTRCLMIGDSSNDILAAKAAGMPVIAVSYGYNHGAPVETEHPDWVVDSFADIHLP